MPPSVHTGAPTTRWLNVIEQHVNAFRDKEKRAYDRSLNYTNGNAWADPSKGETEVDILRASTNLIFPVVETGMTTLVPRKPEVVLNPITPESDATAGWVNHSLTQANYRKKLARSTYHTVLYGLGIMKSGWDAKNDRPTCVPVDPRNYFCDMTAQLEEDLKYEIEATLLSRKMVKDKVEAGLYPASVLEEGKADRYPTWMLPAARADRDVGGEAYETNNLMNYQSWYLVYEVYDRESGLVHHFAPAMGDKPLLTDELLVRPYDLISFNYNGKNVRGLSEIILILSNQKEYNQTESFLLTLLRSMIPGTYYDEKAWTTDKAQKKLAHPIGAHVGITVPANKSVADLFYAKPMAQVPQLAHEMMAAKRQAVAEVSALAAAQRGQVVGAKTATELAFIKSQIADRLQSRQDEIFDLTKRVAGKFFALSKAYMHAEQVVGRPGIVVNPHIFDKVVAEFDMATYAATEGNPAVRAETMRAAWPILSTNPRYNQKKLAAEFLRVHELPPDFMLSDEEFAASQAPPQGAPAPAAPMPTPQDPTQPAPVQMPGRVAAMAEPITPPPPGSAP
mgnify:CR=1 FL=1